MIFDFLSKNKDEKPAVLQDGGGVIQEVKNFKVVCPGNAGWIEYKLNDQEMDYVWRCIDNKKGNVKSRLAGNIDSSYALLDRGDWFYTKTILPLCIEYANRFRNRGELSGVSKIHPYFLEEWWVNYQKQNEFNPLHNHSGIYSFVLWMKIPFSFKEQNRNPIAQRSNNPRISSFNFSYSNILGEVTDHEYKLGSEDEGLMLFFPSRLSHQVYPFYGCDEDRISVSGNISLDSSKTVGPRMFNS